MNRWIWIFRLLALLMILGFMLLFANLQRQLTQMQGRKPPVTRR